MNKYAKIGQIQCLLFFMIFIDHRFLLIWLISLLLENKE